MTAPISTKKQISAIGEEIGIELGQQFVGAYNEANPMDQQSFLIGRTIIEKILAQPGCAGIQLLNAKNELGEDTLVYLGVDADGKQILNFQHVNILGSLETSKGIVADRIIRPKINGIDEEAGWDIE